MRRLSALLIAMPAMALASCTADHPGKTTASAVPIAKVSGKPRDCIPIAAIRESRIRDDSTIDFIGNGREVWRVSLPQPCPSLKSENRFSYETSLSQLCSTDIIYVLHDFGGQLQRGAGCGLSQFVPVTLAGK